LVVRCHPSNKGHAIGSYDLPHHHNARLSVGETALFETHI
jgi:hypothetical protein